MRALEAEQHLVHTERELTQPAASIDFDMRALLQRCRLEDIHRGPFMGCF